MNKPRVLTHDEMKASEAAFRGRPFDPKWSKAARAVYDGLVQAMAGETLSFDSSPKMETSSDDQAMSVKMLNALAPEDVMISDTSITGEREGNPVEPLHHVTSREDAIQAGLVVDVSQAAKTLGLNLAVGITKSLWDNRITGSANPSSTKEREARVRDMLLAVRLRLASLETPTPWVEVPVLFAMQEEQTPELFPIFALFHKDPVAEDCLTLIHPQEISSINMSSSSREDAPPEETE